MSRMGEKQKSAYDLAMEKLEAADREAGVRKTTLSPRQKEAIAEARRVAASRLAELEIRFQDTLQAGASRSRAERDKVEEEYRIDRKRIEDDRDRAIEAIRVGG